MSLSSATTHILYRRYPSATRGIIPVLYRDRPCTLEGSSLYAIGGVLVSYRDHPRTIWERPYIIYRVGELRIGKRGSRVATRRVVDGGYSGGLSSVSSAEDALCLALSPGFTSRRSSSSLTISRIVSRSLKRSSECCLLRRRLEDGVSSSCRFMVH